MSLIRLQPELQLMGYEVATYGVKVAAYGVPHKNSLFSRHAHLSALRIAAIQAGIAAIHHDHRGGAALRAELRAFRKMRF
jgi:hypothetical protein